MAKWKRHSQADVAAKLLQAEALVAQGKRQQDVALALGVSVMTIHRWRKAQPARALAQSGPSSHPIQIGQCLSPEGDSGRIAELELENLRLRRLLTDALLEKIKLEEAYPRRNMSNGLSGPAAH